MEAANHSPAVGQGYQQGVIDSLLGLQHFEHPAIGGAEQNDIRLQLIQLLHRKRVLVKLQAVSVALAADDKLGQDFFRVIEPKLGHAEREVARHAHQQNFHQGFQVRRLE